jgi:hypothetical protein
LKPESKRDYLSNFGVANSEVPNKTQDLLLELGQAAHASMTLSIIRHLHELMDESTSVSLSVFEDSHTICFIENKDELGLCQ